MILGVSPRMIRRDAFVLSVLQQINRNALQNRIRGIVLIPGYALWKYLQQLLQQIGYCHQKPKYLLPGRNGTDMSRVLFIPIRTLAAQ